MVRAPRNICVRVLGNIVIAIAVIMLFKAIPMTYHIKVNPMEFMDFQGTFLNEVNPKLLLLKLADSNDTVNISIYSPGGYVFVGIPYINAIMGV